MDNAAVLISGNPTFQAEVIVNIDDEDETAFHAEPGPEFGVVRDGRKSLKVERANAEDFRKHIADGNFYQITSHPKGRVLLVNNKHFIKCKHRHGSDLDVTDMVDLWRDLGCKVLIRRDQTANRLIEGVKMFSRAKSNADFHVVIIMSHGKKDDLIVGTEGGKLQVKHIVTAIAKSEQMRGKPKLIFFQMCRGPKVQKHTEEESGELSTDDSTWFSEVMEKVLKNGRRLGSDMTEIDITIGNTETDEHAAQHLERTEDVMLAFATQPDYVSFRHTEKGSWFIQCIKEVFEVHAATCDVVAMMSMVKKKLLAYKVREDYKCRLFGGIAVMDCAHTFRQKTLKLFPGFPKPTE